jgi:hypothetical protein
MKITYSIILIFFSLTLKAQLESCRLVITDGIANEKLKLTIEKNVTDFLTSCNKAVIQASKPDLNKAETTNDGRKRFFEIWNSSPIGCSVSTLERKCLKRSDGGYQIRNIPVTMFDAPENDQKQEIVINLNLAGLIDDVFIPITQYSDLLSENQKMDDIETRVKVLDFVENFRTSYNRKDISFIETLFSNNAIIIVGKEIKQKPNTDSALKTSLSKTQFEYVVKNKTAYIAALKDVFRNNKYINVSFDEIQVLKHESFPQVYGVTLKQTWDSSSLKNEKGYVFLLIDFRDENQPLIHVRTWQPEQFEGRQLRRDEVFQIGEFDVNRF